MRQPRIPKQIIWGVIGICVLPFLLNLVGVDFGSSRTPLGIQEISRLTPPEFMEALHRAMRGTHVHTILEWSAFSAAIFTVVLAFIHFGLTRDVATPVIGVALFCAGAMDAFHTLAADRLIESVADNQNLIPFTWALCRIFNALIMIVGVGIFLVKGIDTRKHGLGFVLSASSIFGIVAFGIIHLCATSERLPQTMFPESFVTRPYDVIPLVLFLIAGVIVYPRFYQRSPGLFSQALIISVIPEIATQAHMAFGSTALFDNHFNIAHFLKIIAYLVPFTGLALSYMHTYQQEKEAVASHKKAKQSLQIRGEELELVNHSLEKEVTQRRRMEGELRESEERIRSIVNTAVDAIITLDEKGSIESLNPAAESLYGYTAEEIHGKSVKALMPSPHREQHDSYLANYVHTGTAKFIGMGREVEGQRKDGTRFPLDLSVSELQLDNKRLFTWIARDITERKRAEKVLYRYTEELKRSNADLEQFASAASHDMQEPLRTVASFSQLLAKQYKGTLGKDADEFITYISEGAFRMQALIQDLLAYSRLTTQGESLKSVEVSKLVDHAMHNLQIAVKESQAEVSLDSLPVVQGDPAQLAQLFQNLIGNALKFRGEKPPRIHIRAESNGQFCTLAVEDNGIGIDPKFGDRIFAIFQRLHTRNEYKGTGIGLALCKKIVERHGGRIWVESQPRKGATFYFTLPLEENRA